MCCIFGWFGSRAENPVEDPRPSALRKGRFCGFQGTEVVVLLSGASIVAALITIAALGLTGKLQLGFVVKGIEFKTKVVSWIMVGSGVIASLFESQAFCLFCQRRAIRGRPIPLGNE